MIDTPCARCLARPAETDFCGLPTCAVCKSEFLNAPRRREKIRARQETHYLCEMQQAAKLRRDSQKRAGTYAPVRDAVRKTPWPKVCRKGHDLTQGDLRIIGDGTRYACKACERKYHARLKAERKAAKGAQEGASPISRN